MRNAAGQPIDIRKFGRSLRWIGVMVLAFVYDGTDGTLTVFANGKRIGQATGAPKDREWFPISFSIGGWSGSRPRFRGRLDDVLLYDYPRSEAEIEADAGDR